MIKKESHVQCTIRAFPFRTLFPLLHMEIGMVNQVWDSFLTRVGNDIERISEDEKLARISVTEAKQTLHEVTKEKEVARKTIAIEIRGEMH
jgi:hypothetical protein